MEIFNPSTIHQAFFRDIFVFFLFLMFFYLKFFQFFIVFVLSKYKFKLVVQKRVSITTLFVKNRNLILEKENRLEPALQFGFIHDVVQYGLML